jgi:hypothetical protein
VPITVQNECLRGHLVSDGRALMANETQNDVRLAGAFQSWPSYG